MENLPQNQNQPEQYPVPQLEPTSPHQGSTLMGKFPSWLKRILISVLVLVIVFAGFSFLNRQFQCKSWWPSYNFLDRCLHVIDDTTSNWQTYRNEEYGFEIKAPKFTVEDDNSSYVRLQNFIKGTEQFDEGEYLIEFNINNKNQVSECAIILGTDNPITMEKYKGYRAGGIGHGGIAESICLEGVGKQIIISVIGLDEVITGKILSTFKFIP